MGVAGEGASADALLAGVALGVGVGVGVGDDFGGGLYGRPGDDVLGDGDDGGVGLGVGEWPGVGLWVGGGAATAPTTRVAPKNADHHTVAIFTTSPVVGASTILPPPR